MRAFLLSLTLVVSCAGFAFAQMPVDIDGSIVGIRGNVIAIRDNTGKIYQAEVTKTWQGPDRVTYTFRDPSINVTGTESAENLKPGMVIQFQVILRNKKFPESDVGQVTILTPTPETQAGILLADAVEAPMPEDGKEPKPGTYEDCLVLGQITKARNGLLTVAFPDAQGKPEAINIKLAEDAAIDVSANNLSVVRIGDKIHAAGTAFRLPHFIAHEVKVEHTPADDPKKAIKPNLAEVKPGKPGEKVDPFAVGDAADKPENGQAKPKVKLEILKVN
jgi:hypothetical protein